jgi:hypothetical protein
MGVDGYHHALTTSYSEKIQYPPYRRLGRPLVRSGRAWKTSPVPVFYRRTVQLVTSRYTYYTILVAGVYECVCVCVCVCVRARARVSVYINIYRLICKVYVYVCVRVLIVIIWVFLEYEATLYFICRAPRVMSLCVCVCGIGWRCLEGFILLI